MPSFQTTLWAQLQDAGEGKETATRDFVTRYRAPLLRYVENRGVSPQDAEDIVQEVFLQLLCRDALTRADRSQGRFRGYLLGVARNVMGKARERDGALKRGGGQRHVSLDTLGDVAFTDPDPDFDRVWSRHLLQTALDQLKVENPRQHQTLTLRLKGDLSYEAIADRMARSPQQVKADLHRGRQKLTRLVQRQIAAYSSSKDEFQDEIRTFASLLREGESPPG